MASTKRTRLQHGQPERVIVAIELTAGAHSQAVCRTGTCTWTSPPMPWLPVTLIARDTHLSGQS